MLDIPSGGRFFVAHCDVCKSALETAITEYDAAETELRRLGWLPFPRSGVSHERWTWKCPACLPARSSASMPTTPAIDTVSCCRRSEGNDDPDACEAETINLASPPDRLKCRSCGRPIAFFLTWTEIARKLAN